MLFEIEPSSEAGDTKVLLTRLKAILFDGVPASPGDEDDGGDTLVLFCDWFIKVCLEKDIFNAEDPGLGLISLGADWPWACSAFWALLLVDLWEE